MRKSKKVSEQRNVDIKIKSVILSIMQKTFLLNPFICINICREDSNLQNNFMSPAS